MKQQGRQQAKKTIAAAGFPLLLFCLVGCDGRSAFAGLTIWQAVAVWSVTVLGGAAVTAVLLFMLIFPVINRLFGTHIPCMPIFDRGESPAPPHKKTERTKAGRTSGKDKTRTADQTPPDDSWVKTVRIDVLYHPGDPPDLTASQIDRIARGAAETDGPKKKRKGKKANHE